MRFTNWALMEHEQREEEKYRLWTARSREIDKLDAYVRARRQIRWRRFGRRLGRGLRSLFGWIQS